MNPTQTTTPTAGIIRLPSTELTVGTWDGVSRLLAEFPLTGFDTPFSISKQPLPVDGFILAIRWLVDNEVAARYKFYTGENEVLYYPIYDAEPIQPVAVFEIWSSEDSPVGVTTSPVLDFEITHYTETTQYCTPPGVTVTQLTARSGTVAAETPGNPFSVNLLFP